MLSSEDLIHWFEKLGLHPPNIIRYPYLKESGISIDDIKGADFQQDVCNFILYEAAPRIGHWVILFYNDVDDVVEFFDSYGFMVDDELEFSYHKTPHLLEMMVDSDETHFEVNEMVYQARGTETCGKICAIRYLFNCLDYSKEQFNQTFYDGIPNVKDRDDVIATLYDVLGSKTF